MFTNGILVGLVIIIMAVTMSFIIITIKYVEDSNSTKVAIKEVFGNLKNALIEVKNDVFNAFSQIKQDFIKK